jgi:hypothetical protein
MPTGFQQQNPLTNFAIPKSCAVPQHGQKADSACKKIRDPRPVEARPGR